MARIPEYTRVVFLDRANPGNIEAAQAAYGGNEARGLLNQADQFRRTGAKAEALGDQIMRQREAQGQLKAREKFNEIERQTILYQREQRNQRMTNPDGFAKSMDDWFNQQQGAAEDALQAKEDDEPFDLNYFRQLMGSRRNSFLADNDDWENGMRLKNVAVSTEKNIDNMNVNFSLKSPRMSDLPAHLSEMKDYVNEVGANVFDPDQNHRLMEYGTDQATAVVMDSMLDQDPRGLNYVLNYGAGAKNNVIDFVMFELEGGDKVVSDGDGIAKYGINSAANRGVDVKNLTADAARQIYASKYWDDRLEKFDPAFRAVAFDALVQHGNDKDTWKMITEAKGDPYVLIAKRQSYYASLILDNPDKYLKNKAGWERRMRELTGFAQTLEAGGAEFLKHTALMSPDAIIRAKSALPGAIAAKAREEEAIKKQKIADFDVAYKEGYDIMTKDMEPLGQQELNMIQQLAVNSGDAESIEKASALANARTYVNALKGLGEPELRAIIRHNSAAVNKNPGPDTRLALELSESVLKNQIEAVKNEGLAYYGRINQVRMPQPVNYADAGAAMRELRSREDSALLVLQTTGKLLPVLTPDEIDGLKEQFETLPANQMAGLLSRFDDLDQSAKSKLAQAVDAKSKILGTAISLDNLEARRRILIGAKMEPKYSKEDMAAAIDLELDELTADPEFKASARESVMAWYNAVSQETRDFTENINTGRINDAITQIYGPRVDLAFFGTNQVFSFKDPATSDWLDEDELYDMFNGLTDDQLVKMFGALPKGALQETVTADDIKENGRIISAGDGLYNVVFDGIGGLYGEDANLIEIDGRKLLELHRKGKKVKK